MLVDIANAVGGYLQDVFVGNMDWGILIGYVAQALFAMRFVVQWIAARIRYSSSARRSAFSSTCVTCNSSCAMAGRGRPPNAPSSWRQSPAPDR